MEGVSRAAAALVLCMVAFAAVTLITPEELGLREAVLSEVPVKSAKAAVAAGKKAAKPGMKPGVNPAVKEVPQVPVVASSKGDSSFPSLAKKFSAGVVQILVVKAANQWLAPHKPPTMEEVSGSGFFVDNKHLGPHLANSKDLHIVTNAHVAIDAVRISLRLPALGLLPIPASVVGLSPEDNFDLALLRVDSPAKLRSAIKRKLGAAHQEGLIALPLGNSDLAQAGEKLMALGYPEGLPGVKSTLGVMSGYQQMGHKLYLQMTTPINPGNSGGPLLSHRGHVVGVNTAGLVKSQNIGFSIPSAVLSAVLPVLATSRIFVRPTFGIMLNPTSEHQNRLFGMPDSQHSTGEYISKVIGGSPAAKAGLKQGDILYELGGMPVTRFGQMFLKAINAYVTIDGFFSRQQLGSKVAFKVWRGGKSHTFHLKYQKTPPLKIPHVYEAAIGPKKPEYQIKGGLIFSQLTQNYVAQMTNPVVTGAAAVVPAPDLLKYGKYPDNDKAPKVVIADVASSSVAEGTKVFDAAQVVKRVNKKPVSTMKELCEAMSTPVKDNKGEDWLTVEVEGGAFGAMPMKAAEADDIKLSKTGLFKLTSCNNGQKAKTPKAKAHKVKTTKGKPVKAKSAPKAKAVIKKVAKAPKAKLPTMPPKKTSPTMI